jgi:hypothetical protein
MYQNSGNSGPENSENSDKSEESSTEENPSAGASPNGEDTPQEGEVVDDNKN